MSVREYIKPVTDHRTGIPSMVRIMLQRLGPHSSSRTIRMVREVYEKNVTLIEQTLEGRGVPVESEESAAAMVSHLILDTAVIHQCLSQAMEPVGAFPFDDLAEKILPKPDEAADVSARGDVNEIL